MTLSDLAALGSFVSGVAVLVSLGFLYFQVRQVTEQLRQAAKHTRAQISQNRINRLVDIALLQTGADLGSLVVRGRRGDQDLTEMEQARFMTWARSQFWSAEDNFLQYRDGMLPDETFQSFRNGTLTMLSGAGMQAAWEMQRANFAPEFAAFMDGIAREAVARGFFFIATGWPEATEKFKALEREAHPPA